MIFSKTLRALLALWLFQQAETQTVTVTIGQSGPNVFGEISGFLTGLPPDFLDTSNLNSYLLSNNIQTFVTSAATIRLQAGGDLTFSNFRAMSTRTISRVPDFAKGGSAVCADTLNRAICVADDYDVGTPMMGCLLFLNESFDSMGINDGVTSTTSWTTAGVKQTILFQAIQGASAIDCALPPVAPPFSPPVATPMEPPVAPPVAPPVEPPVAAPIEPPVAAPVEQPVTAPVDPPVEPPVAVPNAAPIEPPVAAPVDPPVTTPIEAPVAAPVEQPVTTPIEAPVAVPVEQPVTTPIEAPVAAPVDPPVTAPVDPPVEPPVAAPNATPIEPPIVAPVDPSVTAPTPVTGPVAAPISTQTAPMASAPVTPPTNGDGTSILAIIFGAILTIIGAIAAIAFCIW